MRSTFKLLFYINRNKVKTDGTTAVLCRISIDGKRAVLTTGIYCQPCDWNARKGIIKTERENNRLIEFRDRVEHTYEHILKESGVVSWKNHTKLTPPRHSKLTPFGQIKLTPICRSKLTP